MDARGPIEDAELEGLFHLLRGRRIAVAVSGGADSTALMLLLARWLATAKGDDKPADPIVLTVDHRLRPEAGTEAEAVARVAAGLGFAHKILVWRGAKPKSGLQEAARYARYRLMAEEIADPDERRLKRVLVLAHTLDDQAETFLMRLARGSGVEGLACMRAEDVLEVGVGLCLSLVRPLLGVPKARLIATLEAAGIPWSEDPSNSVDLFERVRVRKLLAEAAPLGLDALAIGRSAERLGRAETALSALAWKLALEAIDWHDGAYAAIDLGRISVTGAAAGEMLVRLLSFAVSVMGGESPPPALSQLERVAGQLSAPRPKTTTISLGGCLIEAKGEAAAIYREPGRKGLPKLLLNPGETRIWDRRFAVTTAPGLKEPIVIEAMGVARWAKLRSARPALRTLRLPSRAAATLPAFMLGGELCSQLPAVARGPAATARAALSNPLVSIVFRPAARYTRECNV